MIKTPNFLNKFLCLIALCFLLLSCNDKLSKKKQFVIGFSQCTTHDVWRKYMQKEMEMELSFHPEIKLIVKDANLNAEKQIQQIKELMDENVDLIIASPAEAKPITPILEQAYSKNIPVILVDRSILSKNYTAFIGANNYQVGLDAGSYANNLLKGQGNVLEIGGIDIGSSADIGRHTGFTDIIKQHKGLKYVDRLSINWDEDHIEAEKEITKELLKYNNLQLIFTQNDRIGLGCHNVCKNLGIDKKINIISVDGLPGPNGGIDMVEKGMLKATIIYPTGGKEAIQTAVNILENKPFKKETRLFSTFIDSSNVRMIDLQSQKILSQQNDIEKQQNVLSEQKKIYNSQRVFNNILTMALLLVFILCTIVFYSWKRNKRITNKLRLQNEEISKQSVQLMEVSAKAEKAHQEKLNFFTNISHEFRTPLTLIFAPLGELISNTRIQPESRRSLQLIERNAIRLYRLVNQLMDFRKIEFNKMKLKVSECDLVTFTHEIVSSFATLAKNKNIDLEFLTTEPSLFVWFDESMIDKVIFNVLSNAFKFTKENGSINVSVSKKDHFAVIKIKDDGVGMSKEVIDHAFEPFFQGEYENYRGTGLGLALSKELIELHRGFINVKSDKKTGSLFEICFPLGNTHFEKCEFATETNKKESITYEDARLYTSDLSDINIFPNNSSEPGSPKYLTILIVEDNTEMRDYLSSKLSDVYTIVEAENGNQALKYAFESVPDLILCDIVIPGKNGLELTHILKNDIRTSHIPVILLTAKDQDNQKIEGMETQADAYITKPFNLLFLMRTINSLLQNREKIKDHYSGEIFSEEKLQVCRKQDRKFIIEFTSIIETNIGNEKFSVTDICNELAISRVHLYRKIKAILNCNVNDYIISTRLKKAKYYLQYENLTISEIAFKTGFSSAAYFSTVFKSKFGTTPSEFKEKNSPHFN
ncbi:MAG: hybrid sensor histidine kinase/response regulator transcription factor [Ginsengibacter sp.]